MQLKNINISLNIPSNSLNSAKTFQESSSDEEDTDRNEEIYRISENSEDQDSELSNNLYISKIRTNSVVCNTHSYKK